MKTVTIYTDGACSGNPGPGGWGAILRYKGTDKCISGGEAQTTNNRMELTAAIESLSLLKESCEVTLYSDSKYLVDSVNLGWIEKWKSNGWKRNSKEKAKNIDLHSLMSNSIESQSLFVDMLAEDHTDPPLFSSHCRQL